MGQYSVAPTLTNDVADATLRDVSSALRARDRGKEGGEGRGAEFEAGDSEPK